MAIVGIGLQEMRFSKDKTVVYECSLPPREEKEVPRDRYYKPTQKTDPDIWRKWKDCDPQDELCID